MKLTTVRIMTINTLRTNTISYCLFSYRMPLVTYYTVFGVGGIIRISP